MSDEEILVTSRSEAPSIIDINSRNEKIFAQLPDLIQEALVSTEFSSPNLKISRVHNARTIDSSFMTQPMFYITPNNDSGISMVDINITDENVIKKFGRDLTANFADIKAHGAKAFFEKKNDSDDVAYSLCACATGYIWVFIPSGLVQEGEEISSLEIQVGTFALNARAVTTIEIPCRYRAGRITEYLRGELALLCSTVLATYLRLRMMGYQYEYAAESAISQTRKQLSHLRIVDPWLFIGMNNMLREICTNAPLPPTSVVSLISRSMIKGRWEVWGEKKVLRRRYSLPQRIIRCFKKSQFDSIDLLSESYKAFTMDKKLNGK
ncbi:hypothetical protein CJF32_00010904 [Rutstroemia sp. NJR-2017a WRK4]|nr:hypothetical protein CJF32_00010904 [Rutstroemia sp. NJR-2017a WRK4]